MYKLASEKFIGRPKEEIEPLLTEEQRAKLVADIRRYFKRCAKYREKIELDFRDKNSSIKPKDMNRFMRMVLQTRKYERRHIAYVFNVYRSTVRDTSKRIHYKFAELMAHKHPISKIAKHLNISVSTAIMLRDFPIVDTSDLEFDPTKRSRLRPSSKRSSTEKKKKRKPFFKIIKPEDVKLPSGLLAKVKKMKVKA